MGNVFKCCPMLGGFFRCQTAPQKGDAERSPLLSEEGSECETLWDDTEQDLLTNPTLEQGHFLFPDIVLSSSIGVDVAVVEPSVCLPVTKDDQARGAGVTVRGDERTDEEPVEGMDGGRERLCSEVETQTESGIPAGMEAQTQTETQTETQTQTQADHLMETDDKTDTNTQSLGHIAKESYCLSDVRNQLDITVGIQAEKCKTSQTQTHTQLLAVTELNTVNADQIVDQMKQKTVLTKEYADKSERSHVLTVQTASQIEQNEDQTKQNTVLMERNTDQTQQNMDLTEPSKVLIEQTIDLKESFGAKDQTEPSIGKTKQNTSRTEQTTDPVYLNTPQAQRRTDPGYLDTDQTEQRTDIGYLDTDQTEQRTDPGYLDTDPTEQRTDPGYLDTDLTEQDTEQVGQDSEELEQAAEREGQAGTRVDAGEEDGVAESKQITLFMVDKLFLAAPHITGPTSVNQPDEEPKDADEGEESSIQEVIRLQEEGFTVRIQAPGSETFDLQVSGQMLVFELQQVLLDHELTCHRTCFSLQLEGATLDGLTELRSIPSLLEGALLKVVEDPYTVRDARLHLRHVRDLLRGLDPTDAHNGLNGCSLSYLGLYTQGDMETGARKGPGQDSPNYTPPDYILPGSKDRPLMPLQPMREDWKPLQCLRVLTVSSWNPPPGNRKMHGDLMYLNAVTVEDKHLNITASTRGFYLNQSTAFTFNPKPAAPKFLCHSLVELLSQVSPTFRKNFNTLQKMRVLRHPYERIATPFQVFTWTAPLGDHTLNCVRAEETHTSRMGQDEHTAGQSRDWNEELQAGRELPRQNLQERLLRERTLFKTNSDFLAAARRGAMAVVDGNVMAINPGEEPRMQMFIWNSLFFSLGFDVRDHYHSLGGDAAAHAAATCDLRGVQAYAALDTDGLHTLGTAVLDYRGYRVTAQTIVPGILDKDQEQSVVYGSNDYGKTIVTHPRFVELLNSTSGPMRIQRHLVLDHTHLPVDLCSSVETKGILGNDGRHYILDLIRSYPPDLNFLFLEEGEELQEDCHRPGFPRQHPHSLASLRPELLEAFVQHRYEVFLKMVASGLNQEEVSQEETRNGTQADRRLAEDRSLAMEQATALESAQTAGLRTGTDARQRVVIQKACEAVGSVSDSCFDIRFNPNIISSGVRFPAELSEDVQKQRQLLKDVAVFMLSNQIPSLIRDCLDYTVVVMDGGTLTAELHERGVNVRYLGTLLEQLENTGEGKRLAHVQRVAISELIIRSAKHIFKTYLQGVEPSALSAAVSHFLNCLLSSSSSSSDSASFVPPDELLSRRRSRRRRSHGNRVSMVTDAIWARLTPSDLWSKIKAEAEWYYHYTLHCENIDKAIEKYSLQRISLLREMAIKTGIQVQLREYVFESRHRPVFSEEDVINMFPVVKHLSPTDSDATQLIQQSQATIHQGLLKEGCELIRQALTLFSSVCGVLHKDVSVCLRLLGRLCYLIGDYTEALSHQEKAALITERVQGIDHPQTIQDYTHLALYCFAGGQISTSLRLLYRARYLSLLVVGEDHPQVALLDSMLGLVLHGLLEYDLSLRFLQNALTLTLKYHGTTSLKHAQSYHMLAMVFESKGDFRSALQHEKEAYSIYKNQVGDSHGRARESSEYLESLTQQAVTLQRAINHIYSSVSSTCLAPLKFSTPSLPVILQQLNLVCGIILVPLSNKDLKQLRAELKGNREEGHALIQELDDLMDK
ncbi:clustered mitochondria protein homolog [Hypomesus transpacificus]|uniref:clustered mitochondria protein homolog n=1 Tax=Hypomesus transpacificus TaxID=137520 RepID=UPI001F077732|nr:clustered mitochondria protein homolog [Hypomesus transpacificus]